MTGAVEENKLKQLWLNTLGQGSEANKLCQFGFSLMKYERDASVATCRMHDQLQTLTKKDQDDFLQNLSLALRGMVNDFKQRRDALAQLAGLRGTLPRVTSSLLKTNRVTAMLGMRSNSMSVREGETLQIVDASQDHTIKVLNADGSEFYIPVLSCILPSADKSIARLICRLEIELLTNWTETLLQVGSLLTATNKNSAAVHPVRDNSLKHVQQQYEEIIHGALTGNTNKDNSANKVLSEKVNPDMSEALQPYSVLFAAWSDYCVMLDRTRSRTVQIFENIDCFKNVVSSSKLLRCYRTKFVVESTTTREETTYTPDPLARISAADESLTAPDEFTATAELGASAGGGRSIQSVAAEQLTSTHQEVAHRYVIRSVRDPRSSASISLDEAIARGVIDQSRGVYVNDVTGHTVAIPAAMNEGLIQVERVTSTRSAPKVEAIGLITVRDRLDRRRYKISSALDQTTGEQLTVDEAVSRGILDTGKGTYTASPNSKATAIGDAIEAGWVIAEYYNTTDDEPISEVRTYAVRSVVDQRSKTKVSFAEAIARQLIDRDTGNYINNVTGEKVYVVEAIQRGFLKAKVVEDPSSLEIDAVNHVVVERLGKVKGLVSGIGALSALKRFGKKPD